MKFGVFYEHQISKPWSEGHEHRLFKDALDQAELCDKLGFDYLWEVEHHFLEEYSHSSAPEVFLAAASQRTKNIRLGHGIVNLMPNVNHPARVAERIATLDLISDGRVEFGTGESSSQAELGAFLIDRERKREMWSDALDQITRMFVERPYAGHKGEFFSMPPREILPKPLQKPHPPLWVACSRRETIITAAENGIGALSFAFIEPEQAKDWVDEYYEIIGSDRCMPIGFDVNPNVAVVLPMLCHEDEDEALRRGVDGANFFGYSLAHYYVFGKHMPGVTDVHEEFLRRRDEFGFGRHTEVTSGGKEPLGVKLLQNGLGSLRGAIGTPSQITELVLRYRDAGVDQIIFISQCGAITHEHAVESYKLFAKKVMPHFRGDEVAVRESAKAKRLSPAIEAALSRRAPARVLAEPYVINVQDEPGVTETDIGAGRIGVSPPRRVRGGRQGVSAKAGFFANRLRGRGGASGMGARLMVRFDTLNRAVVGRLSDRQLGLLFGNSVGLRVLFSSMAKMYRPERAGAFRGEIEITVLTPRGAKVWTVDARDGRAVSRPGRAQNAKVTLTSGLGDFLRIGTGEIDAGPMLIDGRLKVEGDFDGISRIAEMFGGRSYY